MNSGNQLWITLQGVSVTVSRSHVNIPAEDADIYYHFLHVDSLEVKLILAVRGTV